MPLLAEALISMIPWAVAWFMLGGSADNVAKNIEHFGSAITKGPVDTAVNAYMKVAVFAGALGFFFWYSQQKVAKHEGIRAPNSESIHLPEAPIFGASTSVGVDKGPFKVSQGVSSRARGGMVARRALGSSVGQARRQELVSERVTLDGRPAVIAGWRNQYATVATLPDGPSVQWSWEAADNIVSKGGAFRSGFSTANPRYRRAAGGRAA